MKKIFFGILAVLGFFFESQAAVPSIIWASDPVKPGEAVMVRGDGFGKKSLSLIHISEPTRPY